MGLGMLVAVAVVGALGMLWASPDRPAVDDDVAVPTAVAQRAGGAPVADPAPFVASPSATVLCSDLSEHRVTYAWLDGADLGETVDVHGTPCIVTEIDADAGPRDDPRSTARRNRSGPGPAPRR